MFVFKRRFSSFLHLNERQLAIQNEFKNFAEKELSPVAHQYDRLTHFPQSHIDRLGLKGFMGACVEEKYGGKGYDLLTFSLAIEEISRCCASSGILISIHNCLYADLIQTYGTAEQINEFLVLFTNGRIGVFALSDHDAGSDAANISTTAVRIGNNYLLNGCKAWVTSAAEGEAGVFFACTGKGHKGITAFAVPLDAPGVEIGPRDKKLGIRATSTCDIKLSNVEIPEKNVLGNIGEGFEIAMRQLQLGRIGVGAQPIGIGQAAFDLAVKYSQERTVFDERLCEKQLVKDKLARMATDLESARLLRMSNYSNTILTIEKGFFSTAMFHMFYILVHKAAVLRDRGQDFRKLSSMAKYAASRCATSNAHNCVQILGAKGYVSGEAERHYRDSRITQIYGGATDIQKLIIADLILKESEK